MILNSPGIQSAQYDTLLQYLKADSDEGEENQVSILGSGLNETTTADARIESCIKEKGSNSSGYIT